MTPHPGYRVLWLILHGTGFGVWLWMVLAGHNPAVWITGYCGAVALLEGVSLARKLKGHDGSGTMSWTTWAFLDDGTGLSASWRLVLVACWVGWLLGTFWVYALVPGALKLAALAFGVWLFAHLLGRRSDG